MMLTGHKTLAIFERYNITSGADLTEAAAKLDAFSQLKTEVKDTPQLRLA